jgi:ubiquitin carboxyl-terminal hydrolase L5
VQDQWLGKVGEAIGARIALYSAQEIRFNLMAIVKDCRADKQKRLEEIDAMLHENDDPALIMERHELRDALAIREAQRGQWRIENLRRKHNYIPLIFNVLQVLAERDELKPLIASATATDKARSEKSLKIAKP